LKGRKGKGKGREDIYKFVHWMRICYGWDDGGKGLRRWCSEREKGEREGEITQ